MFLLIDQGNSNLKWCLSNDENILRSNCGLLTDLIDFLIVNKSAISKIVISSVKSVEHINTLCKILNENINIEIQIAQSSANYQSVKNGYTIPEQLGIDRWLVIVACWQRFQSAFMVVDAGSALTLDFVNNAGQHEGGHIIPGLMMQKKLLLTDTDKVRFADEFGATVYGLGVSTHQAVHNGCLSNLCSYINEMYKKFNDITPIPLILTGGDALLLSEGLAVQCEVIPDLVLQGLYCLSNESK